MIVGTVAFCFWYGTWVKAVIESGSWLLFGLLFLAPFVAGISSVMNAIAPTTTVYSIGLRGSSVLDNRLSRVLGNGIQDADNRITLGAGRLPMVR